MEHVECILRTPVPSFNTCFQQDNNQMWPEMCLGYLVIRALKWITVNEIGPWAKGKVC